MPASDVQDPLGLGLRGSARLASRLLYCVTSITPRARYFSFLPWCVYNYQQCEKGKQFALGLWDAIVLREQALTLACIAHHEGDPCKGGALVGSRDARTWVSKSPSKANFGKLRPFAKNPALSAYLNSLVNLGFFETEKERPDTDEETSSEEFTFDDIKLSPLGLDLAKRYDLEVGRLATTKQLSLKHRTCTLAELADFGRHGGLCELSRKGSADRDLLRDIFFTLVDTQGESHPVRRRSLLLVLELCRQFSAADWHLDEPHFSGAVYYGAVVNDESRTDIAIPPQLRDIATRWRMFYFHQYMSVALEGIFSWLVSQLHPYGLAGATIGSLVAQLDETSLRKVLSDLLQINLEGSFGDLSPSVLFAAAGVRGDDLDTDLSKVLDEKIGSWTPFSEDRLEDTIRGNEHLYDSIGLAMPMILLATTLARYTQWEATNYGKWLASTADDPYLDLIPPLLTAGLTRRFGNWWKCSWKELTTFVMSRYVVQQHQSMSYEKTWTGERCLLQIDGQKLVSTGNYDRIGMGNPRLRSAIQIIKDLGLMEDDEDGASRLTPEGRQFLKRELDRESENEVS